MRERGKDKQITHTTTQVRVVYMYTPSLDGVGVCTENTTHQEVLVGVAVEQ